MRRASGMLALTLIAGLLGLPSPAAAEPIRSYDRVVDLGLVYDWYLHYTPRIDEAGNIVRISASAGDYRLEAIPDPSRQGFNLGYTLHRLGETTNLLPDPLRGPGAMSPQGLNASGSLVGSIYGDQGESFSFAPETGQLTWLKPLPGAPQTPQAFSVNNLDQIVGQQNSVALFYASPTSEPVAIADLLGTDTGWRFYQATGINDKGQIVGYGINPQGLPANFRLDPSPEPVPEPSTLALLTVAGVVVASRRFVRRK